MLNLALSAIKDTLESLEVGGETLIEKYAGLVFPISISEEIGRTDGNEPILKNKIFPVACGVNFQECVGQRKYQELVPNSRYKSIAYWEQLADATINQQAGQLAPKGLLSVYDIPVRLVMWMDMGKLNLNGEGDAQCSISAPVALVIQNALFNGRRQFLLDQDKYPNSSVEMVFQGMERKDAQNVFGRYTYGDLTKFLLYPYDFFSLRYLVRLRINRSCIEAFTIEDPINCAVTAQDVSIS